VVEQENETWFLKGEVGALPSSPRCCRLWAAGKRYSVDSASPVPFLSVMVASLWQLVTPG